MLYRCLGSVFIGLLVSLSLPQNIEATITAEFESPADGQPVAGIGTVQGFTFSDTAGVTITEVALAVDGTFVSSIPCCSERGDVAAAFSDLPAENTLNSGFGITQNFNLTSPGEHTLTLTITDSSGAQVTRTHTVTVVQPGGFEFLDHVDLSEASAERQGQEVVLSNVRIRDAASQQAVVINARLRWFRNRQGLGLVEATTVGAASTIRTARPWLTGLRKAKTSAASRAPLASVENPGNGDTVAGAALIQGFAFARAGRSITRVQLFIDGEPSFTIPCCSDRADVAAAFSDEPNALNSGFGVTFNYGLLSSGVHQIMVEIEDSEGDIKKVFKGILVRRPGEFEFLEDLDLSTAIVRIANGCLIIEGAIARDTVTGQTVTRLLRYRFLSSLQSFQLLEEYIDEVIVTNFLTLINGDTSSVAALKADDGGDGISFPEATEAVNNTAEGEQILITFAQSGTIQFDPDVPIQSIQRAKVTIDGDVDGDGAPDVVLDGPGATVGVGSVSINGKDSHIPPLGLFVLASHATIRGLTIRNFTGVGINVIAVAGTSLFHIALVGNDVDVSLGELPLSIQVSSRAEAQQEAHVSNILISRNQLSIGQDIGFGISLTTQGASGTVGGSTLENVVITENEVAGGQVGIAASPLGAQDAQLTQLIIGSNRVRNSRNSGILLSGSQESGSGNLAEALIADNVVSNANDGIQVSGGADPLMSDMPPGQSSGNMVLAEIRGNQVEDVTLSTIEVVGGFFGSEDNIVEAMVIDNAVANAGLLDGINVTGGAINSSRHMVRGEIRGNFAQGNTRAGIGVEGGVEGSKDNVVEVMVTANLMSNNTQNGLYVSGGFEVADNGLVMAEVRDNEVRESAAFGIFLTGGWSTSASRVEAMVADNVVTDSGLDGVHATGGTTRVRQNNQTAALNNTVTGMLLRNNVQGSTVNGIAVFGGFDDAQGTVAGNLAQKNLVSNTADGIVCEDGIIGNTAECTFSDNTDTSGGSVAQQSLPKQTPIPIALVHQLNAHRERVALKEQQIRERAETITDERLRKSLHRLCDRLVALQDKITARMAGKSPYLLDR